MPVPSTVNDLNATAANNSPAATDTVTDSAGPDDYLRAHAAIIKTHSDLTAAHGATGAVVGTTNTQTLTNKTLTAPVVSGGLTVTNTGSGNSLLIEDAASDSTPFVIDAAGRVISGYTATITTARATAGASAAATTAGFQNCSTAAQGSQIATYIYNTAVATTMGGFSVARSRGADPDTRGALVSGDMIGVVDFLGDDGTNLVPAASITALVDATPGTGSMPGRLVFSTTPVGSAVPVERMRISNGGSVIDQAGVAQTPTRSTVASGSTITLTTATNNLLYDQAGTIAALTVTLPSASLTDGQTITIATRSEITALTVNGGTIYGAPTTLAAGGFASFIYSSGATAWFRKG